MGKIFFIYANSKSEVPSSDTETFKGVMVSFDTSQIARFDGLEELTAKIEGMLAGKADGEYAEGERGTYTHPWIQKPYRYFFCLNILYTSRHSWQGILKCAKTGHILFKTREEAIERMKEEMKAKTRRKKLGAVVR